MSSGEEFHIWGPSDLRLFIPYMFVFVLTRAILFGCHADEEHKGPACTLDLKHLVL